MVAPSLSRRSLALGLAALPVGGNAATAQTVTPELVRLIAECDCVQAILDADWPEGTWPSDEQCRAGGRARAAVISFRTRGLPDLLAKAACVARISPPADAEEELQHAIEGRYAYVDDMKVSLAIDLMRYAEGNLCA